MDTTTWGQRYPRIFDLYSESRRDRAPNYFEYPNVQRGLMEGQDFYVFLERQLAAMDEDAWNQFKARAVRYVGQPNRWGLETQLFEAFHEAYGYVELKTAGCREIRFIPEGRHEAPDLEGTGPDGGRMLMEVKTINESDVVQGGLSPLGSVLVLDTEYEIGTPLQNKLRITVDKGVSQLRSIPGPARRILLLFVRLDFNVENAADDLHRLMAQLAPRDVEIRCRLLGAGDLEA